MLLGLVDYLFRLLAAFDKDGALYANLAEDCGHALNLGRVNMKVLQSVEASSSRGVRCA